MSKLDTVREALNTYYSTVAASAVEAEKQTQQAISELALMGAVTDDMLAELTANDIQGIGVPPLMARKIERLCRGSAEVELPRQIIVSTDDPTVLAARMKPHELVAEYDPDNPDNAFGVRLGQIAGNRRFLIFNDDNTTINVAQSAKNLRALLDNYPERANVLVDGVVRETYKVGDRPARFGDENPVQAGKLLQPDGYDGLMIPWGSIEFRVRQLLYIGVGVTKDVSGDMRMIYDRVKGKTFEEVGQIYPMAFTKFKEMESGQQLPQLKIKLSRPS